MESKIPVVISVVTYNRIFKWISLMRNLKKVGDNAPDSLRVYFYFVEDSKTSSLVSSIKFLISKWYLGNGFNYVIGRDNLGESRDVAMDEASSLPELTGCKLEDIWIGFIDDDDRYREDILKVLEPHFLDKAFNSSIINFGMSGNFYIPNDVPYVGHPEPKNRLRKWDDTNFFGCIPSMASFIRLADWIREGYEFGRNIPSEETSRLMTFTYNAPNVTHVGMELMFRHRAKKSLVRDLSIYPMKVIEDNVINHVRHLMRYSRNSKDYKYLCSLFKYNYGGYLKNHGAKDVDKIFNILEI